MLGLPGCDNGEDAADDVFGRFVSREVGHPAGLELGGRVAQDLKILCSSPKMSLSSSLRRTSRAFLTDSSLAPTLQPSRTP